MKSIYSLFLVVVLAITGCASPKPITPYDIQDNNSVSVTDTSSRSGRGQGHFFFLEKVDEIAIHNSLIASSKASSGQGLNLVISTTTRKLPVKRMKLSLVGQVHHSAPIGYMMNSGENFKVGGLVEFLPEIGQSYRVNGILSAAYSAVWVEDINGNIASEIIDVGEKPEHINELASKKHSHTKTRSKRELFLSIVGGENIQFVEEMLGKPNAQNEVEGNAFFDKPDRLHYTYEDLGKIVFSSFRSRAMSVEKVVPILSNDASSKDLMYLVTNSDEYQFRNFVANLYRQTEVRVNFLDVLAQKLWDERVLKKSIEVDYLAWICKILGKSGNPRYRTLLRDISESAEIRKLKKYAKANLDILPQENLVQFVPNMNSE